MQAVINEIAKALKSCAKYITNDEYCDIIDAAPLQVEVEEFAKYALVAGKAPRSYKANPEGVSKLVGLLPAVIVGAAKLKRNAPEPTNTSSSDTLEEFDMISFTDIPEEEGAVDEKSDVVIIAKEPIEEPSEDNKTEEPTSEAVDSMFQGVCDDMFEPAAACNYERGKTAKIHKRKPERDGHKESEEETDDSGVESKPSVKEEANDLTSGDYVDCGYAVFQKLEPIELTGPEEKQKKAEEDDDSFDIDSSDYDDLDVESRGILMAQKRAEKQLYNRNPYRNKPFIKEEEIHEMMTGFCEVVNSPLEYFIHYFLWGVYDLYTEHYDLVKRGTDDESGEETEDAPYRLYKEMKDASIPVDEIRQLAENVYDDLIGAVEQGKFTYGEKGEWESTFSFKTFEDFNPHQIYKWEACLMQDKTTPALRIAFDKFYDIEAEDAYVPSNKDRAVSVRQNREMTNLLLKAKVEECTPIELAIKEFYDKFVITTTENMCDGWMDGRGTPLEFCPSLPDHILRPWAVLLRMNGLPDVSYDDFVGVMYDKYVAWKGMRKRGFLFNAESVVRWNELHGFRDSISHKALKVEVKNDDEIEYAEVKENES